MTSTKTVVVGGSLDDIIDSYDTNKDGKFSRGEVKEIVLAQQEAAKQAAGFKALADRLKALSAVLAVTVVLLIAIMIGSSYIANKITQESSVDSSAGGEGGSGKMTSMTGETVAVVAAKETIELWMAPVLEPKVLKSIEYISVTLPGEKKKDPPIKQISRIAAYTLYSDTKIVFTTVLGKRLTVQDGKAYFETDEVCAADSDCSSFSAAGVDVAAKKEEAEAALIAAGVTPPTELERRRLQGTCAAGSSVCVDNVDGRQLGVKMACDKVVKRGHCELYDSSAINDKRVGIQSLYDCPASCATELGVDTFSFDGGTCAVVIGGVTYDDSELI